MNGNHDPQDPARHDEPPRTGSWPGATLFIVVLVVLFLGLAILALLGLLAWG